MSEIRAGDLVMVVRPSKCCGSMDALYEVFTVEKVSEAEGECQCCGEKAITIDASGDLLFWDGDVKWLNVDQLKRLDPPALSESTETGQKLTA